MNEIYIDENWYICLNTPLTDNNYKAIWYNHTKYHINLQNWLLEKFSSEDIVFN